MGSPDTHARLSPSSCERWAHCTMAPTLEKQFPQDSTGNVFTREGTLAHSFCELYGRTAFGQLPGLLEDGRQTLIQGDAEGLYDPEMDECARFYADYLKKLAKSLGDQSPFAAFEARVDLRKWVPDGFGTCDSVMVVGDTICITDYKHGQGVRVDARDNYQMRLYALGAYERFGPFFQDIDTVHMAIVQPRVSRTPSEETISLTELLAWGEWLRPVAKAAYTGQGASYHEGEWCRWCSASHACKARWKELFEDEEALGAVQEGTGAYTADELGLLLPRMRRMAAAVKKVEEFIKAELASGNPVAGWKLVAGGLGNRAWTDETKALEAIAAAGIDTAPLYTVSPISLAQIEKKLGKKTFGEVCGAFVTRPEKAPAMVPEDDPRAAWSPLTQDELEELAAAAAEGG